MAQASLKPRRCALEPLGTKETTCSQAPALKYPNIVSVSNSSDGGSQLWGTLPPTR